MIWLACALVLARLQLKLAPDRYRSPYNGYGAIDTVLARTAPAPMAYRVLLPWLVGAAEWALPGLRRFRLTGLYLPAWIGLVALALWAASLTLGPGRALLLAVLIAGTLHFEYWDWAGELAGLALALTGSLPAALAGAGLAGLSKETALLVPATYYLVTKDAFGAGAVVATAVLTLGLVRLWAGRKPLYCDRWMWRQNLADLRGLLRNRPVYLSEIGLSLGLTILTLGVVLTDRAGSAWPVPLALLAAGWTLARAAETRVFSACLLWAVQLF